MPPGATSVIIRTTHQLPGNDHYNLKQFPGTLPIHPRDCIRVCLVATRSFLFNERYQVTNLEPAKLKLKEARTASERVNAIQFAMEHGMALQEIEQYLDWLDFVQEPSGEPVPDWTNLDSDEAERPDCGE